MRIPDHLTCLLRSLYADQEATVRTRHGPTGWFQVRKGVRQGCILSPCLFNVYAEYIKSNARLDEAQVEIKIAGRNINNLRYADDTTFLEEKLQQTDSVLKRRDITLPTKVHVVKAMVIPVVMYGCEGWTIKKAEWQRIDGFELWCWRGRESIGRQRDQTSQFLLHLCWKDFCWNWSSSTLVTWCEELTHLERPGCWERLKAGEEWDDRGWDGWMASPTQWTWVWTSSRRWWRAERLGVLQSMGLQRVRHDWATE